MNGSRAKLSQKENFARLFLSAFSLFETEFGVMFATVNQSDNEYPTSAFPRFVGFPDVLVTVARGIVSQTAVARRNRFGNRAAGFVCVADDGTRCRIADGEDRQPLIAVQ